MGKIKKILIANRGEIALRVIRTARELGIQTVAVYSSFDRKSLHVRMADEAVFLGGSKSSESYLDIDKVVNAALITGADAVHPGYGFLSENAVFAKKLEENNIVFIGPPTEAIRIMGSKIESKITVSKYDVPLIPGINSAIDNLEEAVTIASKIGYPVLVKASAGGGGKGMRIVYQEKEIEEQLKRAISEATSAFGDGSVFIEKYIEEPRHIEFQILGDSHGNYIHLFERECSIQRRHQKVVEEAPSPVMDEALRKKMGEAAINVAKSCGYIGAGTVEFILDKNKNFYFLEMNTRLQVEHPITELITGVDLVREQISIAEGNKVGYSQNDLKINGHAIESRVYAEDPENNFLPSTGTLLTYQTPKGPGVRVDDGYEEGMEIPVFYDPMIAKLSVHDRDRDRAINKMIRAIEEYKITGIATSLPFCRFVLKHEAFISGKYSTKFVEEHFNANNLYHTGENEEEIAAVLGAFIANSSVSPSNSGKRMNNTLNKNNHWKKRSQV